MKHILFFCILFCTCSFGLQAQDKKTDSTADQIPSSFSTTSSGLQYKLIKDSVGVIYPETGGFITFWFEMQTSSDSIYDSQFSDPNPVGMPTPTVKHKQRIEEGFLLLTEGDSAVFLLNADSLYQNTFFRAVPEYIPANSTIQMIVKMSKVYSKHFVDSVMAVETKEVEDKIATKRIAYIKDSIVIQEYLTKHKLKGVATTGGVYVVKRASSKKKNPYIVRGEIAEAAYIGKLLIEGSEFDRSPQGTYFEFTVGIAEVIKGWDYAFQILKLGEKALILIPSGLAYGATGAGEAIPPNAPLLYEVEIKK
jgi:FKBP-type peptidyl-prolyl cis-trans isomerase